VTLTRQSHSFSVLHRQLMFDVIVVVVIFLAAAAPARATTRYVAQTAGTFTGGTACNGQTAITPATFNGTTLAAGDVTYICGTITTTAGGAILAPHNGGSSGNPIQIVFDTGASLQAPYFNASNGAINLANLSYVLVNGGTPCGWTPSTQSRTATCNGVIKTTANGDDLANQQTTRGIMAQPCTGCVIENIEIGPLYVHVSGGSFSSQTGVNSVQYAGGGGSFSVHDSYIHDAGFALSQQCTANDTTVTLYNNDEGNNDHDVALGCYYSDVVSAVFVYGNHFHDFGNWDCPNTACHHDAVHAFNGGPPYGSISALYVYNNFFEPGTAGLGTGFNTYIFPESAAGGTPWTQSGTMYVFNNVAIINDAHAAAELSTGTSSLVANNTTLGSDTNTGDIAWNGNTMTGMVFQNNAENSLGYFMQWNMAWQVASPASTSVNYNAYGACNGLNCWNWDQTANTSPGPDIDISTFATWQSQCACDGNSTYTSGGLNLTATGVPNAGSPVIKAGTNLTSLCSGNLVPLCSDITGAARPSSGPWDIGAYTSAASVSSNSPAPPTDLAATVD
jgi:hypothetical protein